MQVGSHLKFSMYMYLHMYKREFLIKHTAQELYWPYN